MRPRFPAALAVAFTVAAAAPSDAALAPCTYDELMRAAVLVVQIADPRVERRGNNVCRVTGQIVRVHRGDATPGRTLTASFACDLGDPMLIGATIYHDPDAVEAAGAVELHFDAEGLIAGYGTGLITLAAPTDGIAWQPVCD